MARPGRSRYLASMRSIWPVVETFRMERWDVEQVLGPFGLTVEDVKDPERRIPQDVVSDLWDHAAALSEDPCFGIRTLQTLSKRRRGLVEYVLFNSPTLGAMIERGLRYERLWQEGREAALCRHGDRVVIRWRLRPGLRFSAPLSEFALAMVVLFARAATGRHLEGEVRFPHAPPLERDRYASVFAGPVFFSAGELSLSFAASMLETPLPRADPALLAVLEGHAQEVLARLPTARSVAHAVRQTVAQALRDGAPSVDDVASRLHMSGRTLRRKLREEGVSYQEVVSQLRRELALEYLRDSRLSITEVAFLVGFADTPTFSKAFRRWTGQNPSSLRERSPVSPGRVAVTDNAPGHR